MLSVRLNRHLLEVKIETWMGEVEYKHTARFLTNLPGATYLADKHTWLIPKEHIDRLVEVFGEKLAWFNSIEEIKGIQETILPKFQVTDNGLDDMKLRPYPFQVVGASFLHDVGCGLLADEMGLGKTSQAIAAVHRLWKEGKVSKVLVVCPSSLKYQWASEIEKFTDHKAIVIDGTPKQRKQQIETFSKRDEYLFAIVNYELVRNDLDLLKPIKFDAIVADEVHRIKNYKAKTTKALNELDAPFKFGLTGTPIQNNPEELYSIFDWINPMIFGSYSNFRREYIVTGEKFGRKNVPIGYRNLGKLRRRVAPYILRRRVQDVATDLPDVIYNTYRIPMTPEQETLQSVIQTDLRELIDDIQDFYSSQPVQYDQSGQVVQKEHPKENQILGYINLLLAVSDSPQLLLMSESDMVKRYHVYLNKKSSSPKLNELLNICREQLESGNNKIVIFTQFVRMQKLIVDMLQNELGQCMIINGQMKPVERQAAIDQFRFNDQVNFLVCTDAANAGLNLQVSNILINVDIPWNPAVLLQRIGRVRRIGSEHKKVHIINLITQRSIDEQIEKAIYQKIQLADSLVEKNEEERKLINQLISQIATSKKRARKKTG